MATILNDIKQAVGVDENNLGFDSELLLYINGVAADAVQNGLTELDIEITEITEWPTFRSITIGSLVKPFMLMKVRSLFDPIPSETINKTFEAAAIQFEGRMAHEIQEVENAE